MVKKNNALHNASIKIRKLSEIYHGNRKNVYHGKLKFQKYHGRYLPVTAKKKNYHGNSTMVRPKKNIYHGRVTTVDWYPPMHKNETVPYYSVLLINNRRDKFIMMCLIVKLAHG